MCLQAVCGGLLKPAPAAQRSASSLPGTSTSSLGTGPPGPRLRLATTSAMLPLPSGPWTGSTVTHYPSRSQISRALRRAALPCAPLCLLALRRTCCASVRHVASAAFDAPCNAAGANRRIGRGLFGLDTTCVLLHPPPPVRKSGRRGSIIRQYRLQPRRSSHLPRTERQGRGHNSHCTSARSAAGGCSWVCSDR